MSVEQQVWGAVVDAHKADLAVWPPKEDGSKAPETEWTEVDGVWAYRWKHRAQQRASLEELQTRYYGNGRTGAGFFPGAVSGNAECLEIDEEELCEPFRAAAQAAGLGDVVERIAAGWSDRTPRGGEHFYYRCCEISGNTRLAKRPKRPDEMENADDTVKTLIETRGEGGYIILAPSNGKVHPSGKPYTRMHGGPATIATITPEEREAIFEVARSFDLMPKEDVFQTQYRGNAGDGLRPGDDFNQRASWEHTGLFDKGWARVYERGGTQYLRRPGKSQGWSASLNYEGCDLFYPFTTSTQFDAERGYSKFAVYAVLNHGGDFKSAAAELAKQGYGERAQGEGSTDAKSRQPSQATQLVQLALTGGCELWHAPDGEPYALIPINGHSETRPLKSKAFRGWLSRLFYERAQSTPGAQVLQDALGVLEGRALYDGQEYPVYVRVARHDGAIWLDMANDAWQAIRITPAGWGVQDNPPVRFRRANGMLALPMPEPGGSVSDLWQFVNVAGEHERALLAGYLVGALRPEGPYPALALSAEQGSGKSTAARIIRGLIDPNTVPLRAEPRNDHDLMIAARNAWLLTFDNLSHIPAWLSNAFCRFSTGGGNATRQLYSDAEEVLFDAQRPVVISSIEDVITRADLLDRTIILPLQQIPDDKRLPESALWAQFDRARPLIVAGLLDAVSVAMGKLAGVKLGELPRMADFALWAVAAESALGLKRGEFMTAYAGNRADAHSLALDAEPVAGALIEFMEAREGGEWTGKASELLEILDSRAGYDEKKRPPEGWPKRANKLSGLLKRLAPNLRFVGWEVAFNPRTGKAGRIITIRKAPQSTDTTDTSDTPTPEKAQSGDDTPQTGDDTYAAGVDTFSSGDDTLGVGATSDDKTRPYSSVLNADAGQEYDTSDLVRCVPDNRWCSDCRLASECKKAVAHA